MDHKYPASYLSADDFYKTFKVFKDHLNEQGPSLFLSALKDQDFGKKESFKVHLMTRHWTVGHILF
jgi:hypothetical protein